MIFNDYSMSTCRTMTLKATGIACFRAGSAASEGKHGPAEAISRRSDSARREEIA